MPREYREPWTSAVRTKFRELFDRGFSAAAIGAELGRTKNAVIGFWTKCGLFRRELPPVENLFDRLQRLHDRMDALLGGRNE